MFFCLWHLGKKEKGFKISGFSQFQGGGKGRGRKKNPRPGFACLGEEEKGGGVGVVLVLKKNETIPCFIPISTERGKKRGKGRKKGER